MLDLAFNSFVTLVVVVDPLGLAPIFAALTRGYSRGAQERGGDTRHDIRLDHPVSLRARRRQSTRRLGHRATGIQDRRGGFALLDLTGHALRPAIRHALPHHSREQEEDSYEEDISVFPLAIPLLAGPGAITGVLLYTGGRDTLEIATVLGVLTVILLLTLLSLLLAPRVMEIFGESGTNVLSRVLGVLLAALAVQFILDGDKSKPGLILVQIPTRQLK